MAPEARYLIVGGSGPVGRRLREVLGPDNCVVTCHTRRAPGGVPFDVTKDSLEALMPQAMGVTHAFLLHGITGIDACARDPEGSHQVNVVSTLRLIGELCARGITPVFASSDAVFDGRQGNRTEEDEAHPILTYGRHKREVERHLENRASPWIVARLAKVIGTGERGDLLHDWLDDFERRAQIRCAEDQVLSPVHVDDVALALHALTQAGRTGLFHLAGPEILTRVELLEALARAVARYADGTWQVARCRLNDLPFAEPRPLDCSMSAGKIGATLGMRFRDMASACDEAARRRFARPSNPEA